VAEAFADGRAGRQELADAARLARGVARGAAADRLPGRGDSAARAAARAAARHAYEVAYHLPGLSPGDDLAAWELRSERVAWELRIKLSALYDPRDAYLAAERAERAAQADLLRDLFGNPFRPVTIDPTWHTPAVVSVARAAYEERQLPAGTLDDTRLAILADALEEAGCTDAALLGHCRGAGPHLRGCFVVDALLDKP
jgi:hypothetical protein